ncbi:MAG: hypothetical protein IPI27_17210 [Betaproteobacteria bacterium]|nr:hypothetical protein [Betaproteobacteria bacterium]
MTPAGLWRRVRHHFSIDAPRMAVRSHLPWPWKAGLVVALLLLIGGMWWWGFDFGQILGGFNRKEVEARITALEAEAAQLRTESAELRTRSSQQDSELAMTRSVHATLTKQATELQNENSQLKEELVFLQQLFADANRQAGLAIQRVAVERERDGAYRYSLLVVRGGKPKDDFVGHLTLHVALQQEPGSEKPTTLALPEEQPAVAPALKLRFKYYQRLEGTFEVPRGAQVRSIMVRAFESGQPAPRATRSLAM